MHNSPIIIAMMNYKLHSIRLTRTMDLKKSLNTFLKKNKIKAGVILSSVGSLTHAEIRLADANKAKKVKGPLEVIHLNGTVSLNGVHLHISVANSKGNMIGGHLLDGCLIHTTCEIVILENTNQSFLRHLDAKTGYNELVIKDL